MSRLLQSDATFIRTAEIGASDAAAEALMGYLGELVFGHGQDEFRLTSVLDEWPDFGEEFAPPCASVVEMPPDDGPEVQMVPEMLEETADCYGPGTVLWKTDERSIQFQVDFWANGKLQRSAIHAALEAHFSPTEKRTGVMLRGSNAYWGLPVRATIETIERRDGRESAEANDRRLRTVIRCDVDVVHLRGVTRLHPRVIVSESEPTGA